MKKLSFWGIVAVALLLIGLVVYVTGNGLPYKLNQAKEKTISRIESKGHSMSDVASIEPWYDNKGGKYYVNVKFKDEPELEYNYIMRDQEIRLVDIVDQKNNSMEGRHDSLDDGN